MKMRFFLLISDGKVTELSVGFVQKGIFIIHVDKPELSKFLFQSELSLIKGFNQSYLYLDQRNIIYIIVIHFH